MAFVAAKCTNCGGELEVNDTQDAAICPYCNTPFVVEKAINNYNVVNNITAENVNIYGGNSADFVIRAGVLEKYNGALQDVVIPDSVVEIKGAFDGCVGLKTVYIPDSVQKITWRAFADCEGLETVYIPDSVHTIGEMAFHNCKYLNSVDLPEEIKIEGEAFYNCEALRTITIRKGTILESSSFDYCGLVEVIFSPGVKTITGFCNCHFLKKIIIPKGAKKIGDNAFSGCISLSKIILPEELITIGVQAFSNCESLSKIVIPDGVETIGAFAFSDCKKLIEVVGGERFELDCFYGTPYYRKRSDYENRNGCYIATAVYGSYDCPEVWVLRRFRDCFLAKCYCGKVFIKVYYKISPMLVKWFGDTWWFKKIFRMYLDKKISNLKLRGISDMPYKDK